MAPEKRTAARKKLKKGPALMIRARFQIGCDKENDGPVFFLNFLMRVLSQRLNKSPQRKDGNLVLRFSDLLSDQLGSEAQRELEDADTQFLRHDEMAKLMDEDENPQDEIAADKERLQDVVSTFFSLLKWPLPFPWPSDRLSEYLRSYERVSPHAPPLPLEKERDFRKFERSF